MWTSKFSTRRSDLKNGKLEKVSLDIAREEEEEELLERVRSFSCQKSHKGFKEKDAMKNAWEGVATVL